ncbi:hypothetical protein LCGC14_0698080 [marine sediment metagenome]|uniref:PEP-CTERM protein-sorting domain-containing protein n=1 Tax=marine sediment metagenome TaxID=412755 RepID=A0A0F9T4H8_9ZZZZ
MKTKTLLLVTVAAMTVFAAQAHAQQVWYDEQIMAEQGHHHLYYTLATQPEVIPGGYRYVIEVFGKRNSGGQNHALAGFERDNLLNLYDMVGDWRQPNDPLFHWEYSLKEFWTTSSIRVNPADWSAPPSQYDNSPAGWFATPHPWGYDGHPVPDRTALSYTGMWEYYYPIGIAETGDEYATGPLAYASGGNPVGEDFMNIPNWSWGWGNNGGLMMTMVLESSDAFGSGDLRWSLPDYGSGIDWAPIPYSTLVDPDGIPGNGDEYLEEHVTSSSGWAEHEDAIDLIDTQTDWNTTIVELIDPDGTPLNGDEYYVTRAASDTDVVDKATDRNTTGAVPGGPLYGVPDGVLDEDDWIDTSSDWTTAGAVPGDPLYGVPDGVVDADDYQTGPDGVYDDVLSIGVYGVADGVLDGSDLRAGSDGLADGGIDFDGDGLNDVFHENYGIYSVLDGGFVWPGDSITTPGDFDGDGDVDVDDVDILCDNLGDVAYDLDGDGDADEDDMIFLIETLVELTDGVRVGTERGDFNLDGLIDGTDLALMKTAFGQPGMGYADGNANCDAFVDGTDLAILKTNFGFIALPSPGSVPEPASAALMLIVGGFLVRRKRRALA